jgi:hypothetical protein
LIAHFAEDCEFLFLAAVGVRRIDKWPMMSIDLTGENRAGRIGIAADSDDGINRLIQKL